MFFESLWFKIASGLFALAAVVGLVLYIRGLNSTITSLRETVAAKNQEIKDLSKPQDNQTKVSEKTVTKVIKGQDTVKIIREEIEKTPNPENCKTPPLSNEARNAL